MSVTKTAVTLKSKTLRQASFLQDNHPNPKKSGYRKKPKLVKLYHIGCDVDKIGTCCQRGAFNNTTAGRRAILFRLKNELVARKVLAHSSKLKYFPNEPASLAIFIERSLSKGEQEIQNKALKKRRELLDHGYTSKQFKICNLKLYLEN